MVRQVTNTIMIAGSPFPSIFLRSHYCIIHGLLQQNSLWSINRKSNVYRMYIFSFGHTFYAPFYNSKVNLGNSCILDSVGARATNCPTNKYNEHRFQNTGLPPPLSREIITNPDMCTHFRPTFSFVNEKWVLIPKKHLQVWKVWLISYKRRS